MYNKLRRFSHKCLGMFQGNDASWLLTAKTETWQRNVAHFYQILLYSQAHCSICLPKLCLPTQFSSLGARMSKNATAFYLSLCKHFVGEGSQTCALKTEWGPPVHFMWPTHQFQSNNTKWPDTAFKTFYFIWRIKIIFHHRPYRLEEICCPYSVTQYTPTGITTK